MSRVTEIFNAPAYGPAPETAKPANDWLEQRGRVFGHFINGAFTRHDAKRAFGSINPANGASLAQLTQASESEVNAAVSAAAKAQPAWLALGGHARARHLYAIARHLQKQSRHFAVLETLDNGKPIRETRDLDIPLAIRHFYHHAGWAQLFEQTFAGHVPHGVVGQIIPWNFPLLMLSWKIAPALAAGNCVVLKPAEDTSLSALAFGELCQQIGLPPGVVNIITGDGEVGRQLVAHPGIHKIAFTGSTEVGKAIRASTAGSGKALSLELGGKSPFIVFEDADLDSAIEGIVDAIWFNQGQVCCGGSRLLIQENIETHFLNRLRARMDKLRVGDPLDKAIDMGTLISQAQLSRVSQLVSQGIAEGALCHQPVLNGVNKSGFFYPPTLLSQVEPSSTLAQVEVFGPVLVSMSFRTPAEAVALANNTRYGLAASVWTEDINLALDIAPKIKAGVVWINCTNQLDAAAGFGGYRESGFGREGGREGMLEYVRAVEVTGHKSKVESQKSPRAAAANSQFSIPHSPFAVDRTAKLYIGGKQARPDGGYSLTVSDARGKVIGEVGDGNRKDVRNAVEAAQAAHTGWRNATAHLRAQVLYFIAENLDARRDAFVARLAQLTPGNGARAAATQEVESSIRMLFNYAAWADKFDGRVHGTPLRNVTLAMHEPVGVIGIVAPPEAPLLGAITLGAAALAMGNSVVMVPSAENPLAMTDFYQVLDTSDVPGGVWNLITGAPNELAKTLAEHNDVEAMWYFGNLAGSALVEKASIGNLKRTWVNNGRATAWQTFDPELALRHATQVKNIWVPYGM